MLTRARLRARPRRGLRYRDEDTRQEAPQIAAMVNDFNILSKWATTQILVPDTEDEREKVRLSVLYARGPLALLCVYGEGEDAAVVLCVRAALWLACCVRTCATRLVRLPQLKLACVSAPCATCMLAVSSRP